jgi:hypothetical protein
MAERSLDAGKGSTYDQAPPRPDSAQRHPLRPWCEAMPWRALEPVLIFRLRAKGRDDCWKEDTESGDAVGLGKLDAGFAPGAAGVSAERNT